MSQKFGAKLEHLRHRHNLTQVELAVRLGLASQAYVSMLETGQKTPSLDLLIRTADVFHVTVDYLVHDAILIEQVEVPPGPPHWEPGAPLRLGEKVRFLRTRRNVSQKSLARQLGLHSRAYLSNIEAGRKLPSPELIVALAQFFDVTTDYLLRDSIPIQELGWRSVASLSEE